MEVGWTIRPGSGQFRAAVTQEPFADSLFGELHYYPCSGVRDADEIARSKQDYVCLTLYEEGEMRMIQRGRTIDARAGDFVVWDTSAPSTFECLAPTRCKLIWLPQRLFNRHVAGFDSLENQIIPRASVAAAVVGAHVRQLHPMLAAFPARKQAKIFESSIEFILSCLSERPLAPGLTKQQQALLGRAKRLIAEWIGIEEITPAAVAQELGISVRYLHRLFALTGQSLMEYVNSQRLEQACQIMSNWRSKFKVAEVAHQVGFYDASHFNRTFKKKFGFAPSQYKSFQALD